MLLLKNLKGGSFSNTSILFDGKKKIVRKSINFSTNREYGLVRWQSQIRKLQILNIHLPDTCIRIERTGISNDNNYYYDMEYHEQCINCYEALIEGESAEIIAYEVATLLKKMANIKYTSLKGSLCIYISEEVKLPLLFALEKLENNSLPLNKKEILLFEYSLKNALIIVNNIINKYKNTLLSETLSHGNLTLENILWNKQTKKIMIIDPYAETYCETIMGDVSQLLQSTLSGYEYISNLFDKINYPIDEYPIEFIPKCFNKFTDSLLRNINKENWFLEDHLMILRASQFIRMFPFKLNSAPRHGIAFMMHGIKLLEKV